MTDFQSSTYQRSHLPYESIALLTLYPNHTQIPCGVPTDIRGRTDVNLVRYSSASRSIVNADRPFLALSRCEAIVHYFSRCQHNLSIGTCGTGSSFSDRVNEQIMLIPANTCAESLLRNFRTFPLTLRR